MTYASGGVIQSVDINGFIGGATANVSGQINTIYSTGNGNAGYGQDTLANVSIGGVAIAGPDPYLGPYIGTPEWTYFVRTLKRIRAHQTGSAISINTPGTGNVVQFLSSLTTELTNAYNSRMIAFTNGTTITGTNNTWNVTATATGSLSVFRNAIITFGSADNARYFFNAGGKINYIISAVDNAGTARSQAVRDLINNMGGITNFATYTNSGRSGTGGSISTNNTNVGYWNNTTTTIKLVQADAASYAYSGYYTRINTYKNDSTNTNGANGTSLRLNTEINANADDAFGGAINVTITTRVDIIPPSTLYLSDTWGTPTITYI